jgi:predicted metalloprotease with PDZ domain
MPNDRAHRSRGGSHARISALLATCALACTPLGERQEEGSDAGGPRIELAAPAGVAAPAEERVRYTLELLDPEQPLVGITLEVLGDSDGESEFGLSEGWAGIAESGKDLELVEARGARDVLASERPESFTWRVRHAPGEPLALVFELGPTRRLLYRAGLLSEDGFLASWNRELAAHAANPARHVPAERVREAFWSDRSVGEVPYQRGDLIALHVDHAIALRSGGARSLDDLMRELVRRARSGAGPFTNEALLAAIGEYAGDGTAAEVREWALEGVEAELAPGSGGPGYEVLPTEVPTFDTGFDHELALKDGTVQGVRAGGPAERAGLRDGMRLAGWSVNFGDSSQPIEIDVREGGATRRISFLPHGAAVPGYHMRRR